MSTSSNAVLVQACLISDRIDVQLPSVSGGIPINWETLSTKDANIIATSRYELLVTTDPVVAGKLRTRSAPTSIRPRRAVVCLKALNPQTLNDAMSRAIQSDFPTLALGRVTAQTAAFADHIFFGVSSRHFFDRFLLPTNASITDVRRRFRRLSQCLHPDRFVEQAESSTHLIARIDAVYAIIADTYRLLSDPVSAAIHRYWLGQGELDKANALHKSSWIRSRISMVESPSEQSQILDILILQEYGKWSEAAEKLGDMVVKHPSNRGLRKWAASTEQVLTILSKE